MFNITQYLNERYKIIKVLGQGSFGKATLIQDKFSNEFQVMKEMNLRNLDEKSKSQLREEGKIISKLDHENIIKLYDDYHDINTEYLFMEYADGGDLLNQLTKAMDKREKIPELKIVNWFIEICEAIKYIHNKNILHRDLKELNIFLTSNNHIKLGDFGLAKQLNSNNNVAFTMVGTIIYESPEILNGRPYDKKSDIWSLGVILYHLITLKHPFMGFSQVKTINNIIQGIFPPINDNFYSRDIINLCYSILRVNPLERPDINNILNQLNKIKNNLLNNNNNNNNQFYGNYNNNLYPNQNNFPNQNFNHQNPPNHFNNNCIPLNNFPNYIPYYQNNNNLINPYNQNPNNNFPFPNNNNIPFPNNNNIPFPNMNNMNERDIQKKRLEYFEHLGPNYYKSNNNNYNDNKVILKNLNIDNLININDINNNQNKKNKSKNTKIIISALFDSLFDIKYGIMSNGTEIILFQRNDKDNQKWEIINNDDESITFKHDNFALSIENGIAENGKKIVLYEYNGKSNQKFFITKLENDWVSFHSALNKKLCIDCNCNDGNYNGKCLKLSTEDNTLYQQFKIIEI